MEPTGHDSPSFIRDRYGLPFTTTLTDSNKESIWPVKNSERLPEKTSRKQRPLQRKNVRSRTCPKRRAPLSAKRERKRQSASAPNDYWLTTRCRRTLSADPAMARVC